MKRLLILFLMTMLSFGLEFRSLNLSDTRSQEISILVEGAVTSPGPVSIHPYATVEEVLAQVELSDNADITVLNPDTVLNNHDVLNIPVQKEESEPPRISINTATAEELLRLPGIGRTTAESIISFRDEHGLFQKREDLLNVHGIGPAKYEKLEDFITL